MLKAEPATLNPSDFISNLKFTWDGIGYDKTIEEMFNSFVTTDDYCDKTEEDRKTFVLFVTQMRLLIQDIDQQITSTVS